MELNQLEIQENKINVINYFLKIKIDFLQVVEMCETKENTYKKHNLKAKKNRVC